MHWLRQLFSRRRIYDDLAEEIQQHLDEKTEALIADGMSREEAGRTARREFGNVTRIEERGREAWQWPRLESIWADVKFAVRLFRKSPGFTCLCVLTIALGIGANAAIFSVVNDVLLQPLPFSDSGRLVLMLTGNATRGFESAASPPDFRTLRERNRSFESLTGFYGSSFNLTGNQETEQLDGTVVSHEFFSTLDVKPIAGRTFLPNEEQWGQHHVAVISEGLWRRLLNGDRNLAGKSLRLNGEQYTVVGVMPKDFHLFGHKEVWVPMAWAPGDILNSHSNYFLHVVGRLKPGISKQQAFADANSVMQGIAQQFPENKGVGVEFESLRDAIVGNAGPELLVLLGAVGFLLLIACVNIANLLLARAATRQREMAIRSAMGAGRRRMLQQFLTESLLLALTGGAAGLALAHWSLRLLPFVAKSLPRADEIHLDSWAIAFTFTVSVLTGVFFGLAPALKSSATDLNGMLKEGGRVSGAGRSGIRLQSALVVTEVALSLVLLVGAALMVQSFARLLRVDAGFDQNKVLTFRIEMPKSVEAGVDPFENGAPPKMLNFFEDFLSRIESLPGVKAAGVSSALPLQGENWTKYVTFADRPEPSSLDQVSMVQYRSVDGNYFGAMGIGLRQGRVFQRADGRNSHMVAIVNEAMARKFWPDENPIGKVISMAPPESLLPAGSLPKGVHIPKETVIGVVNDVRYGALAKDALPGVYAPLTQGDYLMNMSVVVRTTGEPTAMAPTMRKELSQIDKTLAMADVTTMDEIWADSVTQPRLESFLLGVFGGLGLILAAVGIYGLTSYSVVQRTQEIGIRMALGARHSDVLKMVITEGMKVTAFGIGLGVASSLLLSRLMTSVLYGVKPMDPLTYVVISLGLAVVALLANYTPARRAVKVDPAVAFRAE